MENVRFTVSLAAAGFAHAAIMAVASTSAGGTASCRSGAPTTMEAPIDVIPVGENPDPEVTSAESRLGSSRAHAPEQGRPRPISHRATPSGARSRSDRPAREALHVDPADSDQGQRDGPPRDAAPDTDPDNAPALAAAGEMPLQTSRATGRAGRADGTEDARSAARNARLSSSIDVCRDVFPSRAEGDRGMVTVALQITERGAASATNILSEQPSGQGFARAARLCSERLRFDPAIDEAGWPVASRSVVRLRFVR